MTRSKQASLMPVEHICRSILVLRGRRVILDRDLAAIYASPPGASMRPSSATSSAFRRTLCFGSPQPSTRC